jgi:1-deoxy-D-xylulose 5-phosphate reductoisomerase
MSRVQRLAILGASGSIGQHTLAVVRQHRVRFQIFGLAARRDWQALLPLIQEFAPRAVVLEEPEAALALREALGRHHLDLLIEVGPEAVSALAASPEVEGIL